MSSKKIEQTKDREQTKESNDYLKTQGKAFEESFEDVMLQEHSPDQDYDVTKEDVTQAESLTDKEIDKNLRDGFQAEDLDKVFPNKETPVSKRFNDKTKFVIDGLKKSLKDNPDLTKTRDLIQKSLENKSSDWIKSQNKTINEKYDQSKESSDSVIKTVAITGLKLVPFAGPISDISEGVVGKDMYGNKLTGKERLYKTLEGSIFLAIDATGYGVIATEGVRASKLITRSAALLRKLKVSPRIYKSVYKTGVFIKKNKNLARLADVALDSVRAAKFQRKDKDLEDLKPLLGVTESDHEAIDIAREIPEFKAHIEQFQEKHGVNEHDLTQKHHQSKAKELLKSIESGNVG